MATIEGPETSSFAIVGYAARFPGATDAESFWEMLREGRDAVSEVPQDRWDVDEFFDAEPGDFLRVKVVDADEHDLYAEIAEESE